MPTVLDKQSMVDLLRNEFSAVAEVGASLSEDQWNLPTCLPGWSARDTLSHMIGTESILAGVDAPVVDVPEREYVKNPIGQANEVWIESMRGSSGSELLTRFIDVTNRRVAALDAMSQSEFDAPSWTPAGRDETYGRFMRIRHFDCFMHEQDIRLAVGVPSRDDPADLRSALDEVATGLGYIVGRKAGMPDGTTVRISLTGPLTRTFFVAVDGRAAVVEGLAGDPTVELEMPAPLFLRLTGGRVDAAGPAGGSVSVSGDEALGARLVANLAFTI